MGKIIKYILAVIFLNILLTGHAGNLTPQAMIDSATQAYTKGFYQNAAEWYEKVLEKGFESPELYYNLGNAYFKLNDMAHAIFYYEKALLLDPSDEDILFNLNLANTRITDKIEVVPDLFFERWGKSLYTLFPGDSWAWLSIVFTALFFIATGIFINARTSFYKRTGFYSAIIFLILLASSISFAWKNQYRLSHPINGIVFEPSVTVKSSPDPNSVDLFVIHEGTKVRISDSLNQWYKIKIANGSVGWIPNNTVRRF